MCPFPGAVEQCQHLALTTTPSSLPGGLVCKHEPDGCLGAALGSQAAGERDLEQPRPGPAGEE